MSIFEFDDQQGVRTRGTLRALGATPGDVLTVGTSRGTVTPSPGGGSQPVACVLAPSAAIDLAAGSPLFFVWDTIYDNPVDENELTDLPAGIGIDPASVGTDTLTTIEAGVWAFTLLGLQIGADATWDGALNFGNYGGALTTIHLPVVAAGNRLIPQASQIVNLPSGTGFSVGIASDDPPTHNPFNVGGPSLVIVRLG